MLLDTTAAPEQRLPSLLAAGEVCVQQAPQSGTAAALDADRSRCGALQEVALFDKAGRCVATARIAAVLRTGEAATLQWCDGGGGSSPGMQRVALPHGPWCGTAGGDAAGAKPAAEAPGRTPVRGPFCGRGGQQRGNSRAWDDSTALADGAERDQGARCGRQRADQDKRAAADSMSPPQAALAGMGGSRAKRSPRAVGGRTAKALQRLSRRSSSISGGGSSSGNGSRDAPDCAAPEPPASQPSWPREPAHSRGKHQWPNAQEQIHRQQLPQCLQQQGPQGAAFPCPDPQAAQQPVAAWVLTPYGPMQALLQVPSICGVGGIQSTPAGVVTGPMALLAPPPPWAQQPTGWPAAAAGRAAPGTGSSTPAPQPRSSSQPAPAPQGQLPAQLQPQWASQQLPATAGQLPANVPAAASPGVAAVVWELATLMSMRAVLKQALGAMSEQLGDAARAMAEQQLGGAARRGLPAAGDAAARAHPVDTAAAPGAAAVAAVGVPAAAAASQRPRSWGAQGTDGAAASRVPPGTIGAVRHSFETAVSHQPNAGRGEAGASERAELDELEQQFEALQGLLVVRERGSSSSSSANSSDLPGTAGSRSRSGGGGSDSPHLWRHTRQRRGPHGRSGSGSDADRSHERSSSGQLVASPGAGQAVDLGITSSSGGRGVPKRQPSLQVQWAHADGGTSGAAPGPMTLHLRRAASGGGRSAGSSATAAVPAAPSSAQGPQSAPAALMPAVPERLPSLAGQNHASLAALQPRAAGAETTVPRPMLEERTAAALQPATAKGAASVQADPAQMQPAAGPLPAKLPPPGSMPSPFQQQEGSSSGAAVAALAIEQQPALRPLLSSLWHR
jgi:hypothetical protein